MLKEDDAQFFRRQPPLAPELRGIFGAEGDSSNWLEEMKKFDNGVPRFESQAECLDFMKRYNNHHGGSNPDHPELMHIFTMLISWEQIETILLPAIEEARKEPSSATPVPRNYLGADGNTNKYLDPMAENIYERPESKHVVDEILFRLELPIHRCTTPISTLNTLKYLFYHMKCGIFVMIRNGKLRIFCPFVNRDYRNTWNNALKLEGNGTLHQYRVKKVAMKKYRRENVESDRSLWWANGNIICNELVQKESERDKMQHWGDHFLAPLRDMLAEACNHRAMPDCEFFLNKRDYPQLKVNVPRGGIPVEPYGFIFDRDDRIPDQDKDLVKEHTFTSYAPIVSFYAAAPDRFSDIPWPSSEDWEAACGLVFPPTFIHSKNKEGQVESFHSKLRDLFTEANFRKFECAWEDNRAATAFFRGTATGGGTKIENNQRLKLAYLSHEWKDDPEKGDCGKSQEPYLDAAIVGWNLRDKKIAESPMTFLRPDDFPFGAGRQHYTPIYEQSKYKYLVYVDGHCAACRYGFMMRLGSVILKVASRQVADRMWYFPLLKPYVDHVPVKADLSDLEEKIRWCRENDDKCKEIGRNAMVFYEKYVARSALLDYVQMVCKSIAARYVEPPDWWRAPPPEEPLPKLPPPETECYKDKATGKTRLCVRCREDAEEEQRQTAAKRAKDAADNASKVKARQEARASCRARMKKRIKK